MDLNDVIKLVNAGFSKEDVLEFAKFQAMGNGTGGQKEEHEEEHGSAVDDNILEAIKELSAKVSGMAVNASAQPEEKSSYDILASIINPPVRRD